MANTGYIGVGPADRDPTVTDDSVTTAKIQDAAVTAAKFATTGTASSTTFLLVTESMLVLLFFP